jgi:hypothetical protein
MPSPKLILVVVGFAGMVGAAHAQQAQPAKPTIAWAPKPARLTPYTAPNKPLWKLSEILKKHAGQQDWARPGNLHWYPEGTAGGE